MEADFAAFGSPLCGELKRFCNRRLGSDDPCHITPKHVLASGSLREKIVRFLFQNMDAAGHVELAVSREYLAAYLAVTRPSLSRELSAMQKDGLLKVAGKNLQILDLNRFEEYL